jgi:hypothetical protein
MGFHHLLGVSSGSDCDFVTPWPSTTVRDIIFIGSKSPVIVSMKFHDHALENLHVPK